MNCDQVQAEVSTTLDEGGELSPKAARHLSDCADCSAFRIGSIELANRGGRITDRRAKQRLLNREIQRDISRESNAPDVVY